jgi:uncharacterized protein YjbI with pentapeptide repeats
MLSVYVRELSKVSKPQSHPRQEYLELVDPLSGEVGISVGAALQQLGKAADDVSIGSLQNWARGLKPFRTDVEKAAQTLGRLRDIAGVDIAVITIDLRGANLQGFDLDGLCFAKAKLSGARMEAAYLWQARMEGADLGWARMEGADLSEARMEGANLSRARMEGASLYGALMEGADLKWARMEGAILSAAWMEGADLRWALMEGADLRTARFDSATSWAHAKVSTARAQDVDFAKTPISDEQVKSMFGDASVTLPNGITPTHPDWPAHWPRKVLEWNYFNAAYTAWLAIQP